MPHEPSLDAPLPWANGPYSVKRHGVTITNCDSEPVQTPGCIQPHGALLVLRPADLTILQVSENVDERLGMPPSDLLNRPVGVLLEPEACQRLRAVVALESLDRNPTYVCTLPHRPGVGRLDVVAHSVDGVLILELEAVGRNEAGAIAESYESLRAIVTRLQACRGLQEYLDRVASEVRNISGLDRVMVYRFHPDGHGEVVAESMKEGLYPWLGLHYPAEDIPLPAREIFGRIAVRPLCDVKASPAEMVPLADPDTGRPLDMTYCQVRGASVMYTEYLENMGVASSLTLAIRRDGDLWGLVAGHHATPRTYSYELRATCELISRVVSLQLESIEDREQLAYRLQLEGFLRHAVEATTRSRELTELLGGSPNVLDFLRADGAAFYHDGGWSVLGESPDPAQLDELGAWLEGRPEWTHPTRPVFVTDNLSAHHAPAAALTSVASGLLAVPLSRLTRMKLLWFRGETIRKVRWAGNPHEKPTVPGPNGPRLTPRRSFELFVESVANRSFPWEAIEVEAALRLRSLMLEVVLGRFQELEAFNAQLVEKNEELDAFAFVASHDLREPLRGILRLAHLLHEQIEPQAEEARQRLVELKDLCLRMESLLGSLLRFSRVGRDELRLQEVDLQATLAEAMELLGSLRAPQALSLVVPRPLPKLPRGYVHIREVLMNLIGNAMKYTDRSVATIEVGYLSPEESRGRRDFPPGAEGHTVVYVRDDGIGIAPEHREQVFKLFKRLHGREAYGGGTGAGLTIVKKLVERHGGRIWFESEPGMGSTFYFSLATA